jgi:hypothetical protein
MITIHLLLVIGATMGDSEHSSGSRLVAQAWFRLSPRTGIPSLVRNDGMWQTYCRY